MTVIEKYVCDFCGKEFDDDGECYAHEIQEQFDSICQSVIFLAVTSIKFLLKIFLKDMLAMPSKFLKKKKFPLSKSYLKNPQFAARGRKKAGTFREKLGFIFGITNAIVGLCP